MIERVVVVPRNGYANRLQAWASSAILANQLKAELSVCWDVEEVAQTPAEDLFSPELLSQHFISVTELEEIAGSPHQQLPRYLNFDESRGLIVLAGHKRGEQAFMNALGKLAKETGSPTTLIIVAGGKFHLRQTTDFDQLRRNFYRSLTWSNPVERGVTAALADAAIGDATQFSALHVRETDRSKLAPSSANIRQALLTLLEQSSPHSLLICADTAHAREKWKDAASGVGFDPWIAPNVTFNRTSIANGISALIDWRLIAMAQAVIYPAESTFSSEAVVAGDAAETSVALQLHSVHKFGRFVESHLRQGRRSF